MRQYKLCIKIIIIIIIIIKWEKKSIKSDREQTGRRERGGERRDIFIFLFFLFFVSFSDL